jgi:hypothetical protein
VEGLRQWLPIWTTETFVPVAHPAQPSSRGGVQVAPSIINQVRLIILVFGGEPEGVGLGHRTGGAEEFPEGAFEASPRVLAKSAIPSQLQRCSARTHFSEPAVGQNTAEPVDGGNCPKAPFLAARYTRKRQCLPSLTHGCTLAVSSAFRQGNCGNQRQNLRTAVWRRQHCQLRMGIEFDPLPDYSVTF